VLGSPCPCPPGQAPRDRELLASLGHTAVLGLEIAERMALRCRREQVVALLQRAHAQAQWEPWVPGALVPGLASHTAVFIYAI
jgi:hypothetical protein